MNEPILRVVLTKKKLADLKKKGIICELDDKAEYYINIELE